MEIEKYRTISTQISTILGYIAGGDIAVPEIQRPFVWRKTQVRDLLDSLYKGFPTGYLITWKNPDIRLRNGGISSGKKILIDGQQRVTALMTAISGIPIVNNNYSKERIKIAFNPFEAFSNDPDSEIFAVQDSSHIRSKRWIADIAEIFKNDFSVYSFIEEYCKNNPEMEKNKLDKIITKLRAIENRTIGVIELDDKLSIDVVTDIFIRINSKGTSLSQGDFVMSKIASDEKYDGNNLRKAIDYYSHLSKIPSFHETILQEDQAFTNTEYFDKITWLKDETEDVFDPDYNDVIRVAFMHMFPRAKLSELVSLLSGRDFNTREYKEEIVSETYGLLKKGVLNVFNEYNFKQFMLAIRSAGFVSKKLVNSKMALDFAYTLYLRLIQSGEVPVSEVKRLVQKWYVLSVLTGRYSGSPESVFAKDIRLISEKGGVSTLKDIEAAEISDNFWNTKVVQDLDATSTINPTYLVFLAAQVSMNDVSLLSNNILVRELIENGDVHHIFPKEYLKSNGYEKSMYNQEGNYAFLDTQINKAIGKLAPHVYFSEAKKQCETGEIKIGSITNYDQLIANLQTNCVPLEVFEMDHTHYKEFLEERRVLMAKKIRKYYESL
ncbi:DUF262 domain-containing protein [bacterium]|nr:DUF262 domain-containing protein [bacterium]